MTIAPFGDLLACPKARLRNRILRLPTFVRDPSFQGQVDDLIQSKERRRSTLDVIRLHSALVIIERKGAVSKRGTGSRSIYHCPVALL
jgi:hypothetical protein